MQRMVASVVIALVLCLFHNASAAGTDKTLVSWVILDNTTQQGGSALTIQRGDQFDGIVFGERASGKWMAGSDFFARTQGDQQANAVEKADSKTLIQMAIVYKGTQISLYRNGEPYASYEASNIDLLTARDNQAVFGLRHEGAGTGQHLRGSIEDARIYDTALSADEIKKLEPKKESAIRPYAWWTFEKGKETDRMGRFPVNNLDGGAKIEGGRLVLETDGAALIAAARKTPGDTAVEFETPAMPANPPDDWLTYHLLHPGPGGAMPGDPNCAFYWKGLYHLHYIYNHRKGFAFAHVSSKDLVHWTWHPTTLFPKTTGHGMFSGTGFITKEGQPAIIYHGQGSGRNQLAFALDDKLEQWTKPVPIIPKDASGQEPKFNNWDPDCWLNGDTYYAISGGGNPSLMKSSDLKNWLFLGPLLHDDYPANIGMPKGEDISCANMFKIGKKWMLLCISHGLGCRYYLGDFKDEKYLPEFQAMMSWNGNNYFAPESVLSKDGRRVMWAWLLNLPVAPCGVQSLPRELELPEDGVLRIRPLRELEGLRYDGKQQEGITVKSDAVQMLKEISGNTLELEVAFKSPAAKEFGLDVLCDKNGENGVRVAYLPDSKTLRVGKVNAPFELKPGEDLILRVFIDKNLVEVFANDRQAAVSAGTFVPENLAVRLFSKGGDTTVKQVKCWKMKTIYAGATGVGGHINVDQIAQSDIKPPPPQLLANAKRDFKIEKHYLNIPIKNGSPMRLVTTRVDGRLEAKNDIGLADGVPDWWAFVDVGAWHGNTVTIEADKLAADSTALSSIEQSDSIKGGENLYREPLRAQLHFSSRRGWNNDPNGMVFSQGEYHLYYQHNPYGWNWGNMHWGHAVSRDMVHWQELPIAIYMHAPGDAVFSGSAVVDKNNTSGWKKGPADLLVAAFTSTGRGECIVYSNDRGRTFSEYEGNPVVKHGGRDPRLLWHAPSKQWVMAVYDEGSGKQCIAFHTSPDLTKWTYQSRIAGFYECPDFFELAVDGVASNKKWVLTAASSEYMVGSFDGKTFTPETTKLPGHRGAGFYAAQTFTGDPKGRVVQIGWLQTETRGMPFNQAMSLPLQLSLHSTPDGPRLAWTPVDELKTLRATSHDCGALALAPGAPNPLAKVSGELLELRATFAPPANGEVKFTLRGVQVIYKAAIQELVVNGRHAPAPLREGRIDLAVFTDRTAYEVFTAGGLTYVPLPCTPNAAALGVEVSVTGGNVTFDKLEVHELKSIWTKAKP